LLKSQLSAKAHAHLLAKLTSTQTLTQTDGQTPAIPIRKQIEDPILSPSGAVLVGEKQTSAVQLPECGIWWKQCKSFDQK